MTNTDNNMRSNILLKLGINNYCIFDGKKSMLLLEKQIIIIIIIFIGQHNCYGPCCSSADKSKVVPPSRLRRQYVLADAVEDPDDGTVQGLGATGNCIVEDLFDCCCMNIITSFAFVAAAVASWSSS